MVRSGGNTAHQASSTRQGIKRTVIGLMVTAKAFLGLNDLGHLVTPIFLLMDYFLLINDFLPLA